MVRARVLITLVVLVTGAMIAVAGARPLATPSLSVTETPLTAGKPTALSLHTTFSPSTHGELGSIELDLARGFRFDPRAAAVDCTGAQAQAATCPVTSTIGSGTGTIVVAGTYLPRTSYSVSAAVYLTGPRHRGDIAGLVLDLYETESQLHVTMFGRVLRLVHGPYGIALRFADAGSELPSGYRLTLLGLSTLLQGHRTVSVNKRPVNYDLLTNPGSCARHGWPAQVRIESGGQLQVYRSTTACSPAPSPRPHAA